MILPFFGRFRIWERQVYEPPGCFQGGGSCFPYITIIGSDGNDPTSPRVSKPFDTLWGIPYTAGHAAELPI
jgi:hypothetical protein